MAAGVLIRDHKHYQNFWLTTMHTSSLHLPKDPTQTMQILSLGR
jgi:hypothetical protein